MSQFSEQLFKFIQMIQPSSYTEEKQKQPKQYSEVDLVKTSLNFVDIDDQINDSDFDFQEVSFQQHPYVQEHQKEQLVTFSDLLSFKGNQNNISQKPKTLVKKPKNIQQKPVLEQVQLAQPRKESKHLRGPSKIKDILASLKSGVLNDLQKIADELFQDIKEEDNSGILPQRISFSQVNMFNDEDSKIQERNLQSFQMEDNSDNSQDSNYMMFLEHYQEDSIDIQQSNLSEGGSLKHMKENNPPEIQDQFYHLPITEKRLRKHRNLQRKHNQYLDIIQEQSHEQITPEKSYNNPLCQNDQTDNMASVPCFRATLKEYSPLYLSQRNKMQKEYQLPTGQNINQSAPRQQQLIRQIPFLVEDLNIVRMNDACMSEEDAIMESWNNLCTKIIQKNLLPMTLNVERIQEESNLRSRGNIFQKLAKAKRKIQMVQRLQSLNQFSNSSHYNSTISEDEI